MVSVMDTFPDSSRQYLLPGGTLIIPSQIFSCLCAVVFTWNDFAIFPLSLLREGLPSLLLKHTQTHTFFHVFQSECAFIFFCLCPAITPGTQIHCSPFSFLPNDQGPDSKCSPTFTTITFEHLFGLSLWDVPRGNLARWEKKGVSGKRRLFS